MVNTKNFKMIKKSVKNNSCQCVKQIYDLNKMICKIKLVTVENVIFIFFENIVLFFLM